MKILMLVNWKVEYGDTPPPDKQPPDYFIKEQPYWFFRYFKEKPQVDVVDIHSFPWLEHWEKEKLRFYVWQTLKVLPRLGAYDLILSHGMQSGVVLSLIRRFFSIKAKHIVFDIGAFNSAAESGAALKLMQFASHSIDGIIYHTSRQREYYEKCFPWILERSVFIKFGTDAELFSCQQLGCQPRQQMEGEYVEAESLKSTITEQAELIKAEKPESTVPYILCVGYAKRDWETLYRAWQYLRKKRKDSVRLRLIGYPQFHPEDSGVESLPVMPLPELMTQIRQALFCVLPLESFLYSFGQMTLLQQMALGKAVITARVPSMTDYVKEEQNALLYEPGNAKELCDKLELLLEKANLREQIGQNAAWFIQKEWNETHMAAEIEKYIKECMGG